MTDDPIAIDHFRRSYERGSTVAEQMEHVRRRIEDHGDAALFIGPLCDIERQAARLDQLTEATRKDLPLFGIPFAVKDNIDVAGTSTTAACPDFARRPDGDAVSVRRLLDAGAVVVGKTNLDQFATGLVGTRSPYGAPRNPLDPTRIPGGSSSGSAVAVATGLVAFALGTDTAGSGRVPAAMNQVIGLKPTRGLVSNTGVLPACASLDCVSIFAGSITDAVQVFDLLDEPDDSDPWRRRDRLQRPPVHIDRARIGTPSLDLLTGVDDTILRSYQRMLDRLAALGTTIVEIPLEPFLEAGALLYGGPMVAERYAAVESFLEESPASVLPTTRSIIAGGATWSAADYHRAMTAIGQLRIAVEETWRVVDAVALPTVPFAPSAAEVAADPTGVNDRMGTFTTFTNLLDLAAVTVPDRVHPRPGHGLALHAPACSDLRLAALAAALTDDAPVIPASGGWIDMVVVGAHLEGQPLHHQLTDTGATLRAITTTAPRYRLWALPDGRRPALEHVRRGGAAIEVEVWSVPSARVGELASAVQAPLALGPVELADGTSSVGFLCAVGGLEGARDITDHGGWRSWLASPPRDGALRGLSAGRTRGRAAQPRS